MNYRILDPNANPPEIVQGGDEIVFPFGRIEVARNSIGKPLTEATKGQWRRQIRHNWIAFKDRIPARSDANKDGKILLHYNDNSGTDRFWPWDDCTAAYFWMPLNFYEPTPARVAVRNEQVVPQKDGSVKVGCTTISKEDFDTIISQRETEMKGG